MTEWLMVIITGIYVVATIAICYYNAKAAKAAKEQAEVARKQIEIMVEHYNDENRPKVVVYFDIIRSGLMVFVVENIGTCGAENVAVRLNEEFMDNVDESEKECGNKLNLLRELTSSTFYLSSHQKLFIIIDSQLQFSKVSEVVAEFDISYSGKYHEHTTIDIKQYRFALLYKSELEDVAQHMKKIKEQDKRFQDYMIKEIKRIRTIAENLSENNGVGLSENTVGAKE